MSKTFRFTGRQICLLKDVLRRLRKLNQITWEVLPIDFPGEDLLAMPSRFAFLLPTFVIGPCFAAIHFSDGVFPELVPSARALAMGNAFIARVDDEAAPFYNPAGLGTVRDWTFHVSNFLLEVNKGFAQEITADGGDALDRAKARF